jgi:hypothetical protein
MQVYDGECSIDGAYQPILPDDGRFIGMYVYVYKYIYMYICIYVYI